MNSNMFVRIMAPAVDPTEGGDKDLNVNENGVPQDDPDLMDVSGQDDVEEPDDEEDDDEIDEDEVDDDDEDDDPRAKDGKKKTRRDDSARIEQIASAVARGMHANQPRPAEQQKPLTDAEIKKLLNVYEIDNDTIKEMLGMEKDAEVSPSQLKAAQRMVANIVKNATTVSNATTNALVKKLEERLGRYDEFIAKQTQEQASRRFFSKYSELKPYEKIVAAVATNLSDSDPNWANIPFDQGAKMVAREVRRILKDSGITLSKQTNGEANLGAEHAPVRNNGVPAMSTLAGSGRSSTTGQRGKQGSADADVYGPGNSNW